jgi:hypothetical protein
MEARRHVVSTLKNDDCWRRLGFTIRRFSLAIVALLQPVVWTVAPAGAVGEGGHRLNLSASINHL